MATVIKLLGGRHRGKLAEWVPKLHHVSGGSRHKVQGYQLIPFELSKYPLDCVKRSFFPSIHKLWSRIPQDIIEQGLKKGWKNVIKKCKRFLINDNKEVSD